MSEQLQRLRLEATVRRAAAARKKTPLPSPAASVSGNDDDANSVVSRLSQLSHQSSTYSMKTANTHKSMHTADSHASHNSTEENVRLVETSTLDGVPIYRKSNDMDDQAKSDNSDSSVNFVANIC